MITLVGIIQLALSINSDKSKEAKIIRIGDTAVLYDDKDRVAQVGDIKILYDEAGKLCRAGPLDYRKIKEEYPTHVLGVQIEYQK